MTSADRTEEPWLSPPIDAFFKQTVSLRQKFSGRYRYYHQDNQAFIQKTIPPDASVLIVGCDVLPMAEALRCRAVYVYDLYQNVQRPPERADLHMVGRLSEAFEKDTIDYVVLPYTLQLLQDIQAFLDALAPHMTEETRVVFLQYNFLWAPLFKVAQRLHLKTPYPDLNWLNLSDIRNIALLSGYQDITQGSRCLIPIYIPLVTRWVNRYLAPLPFFAWLCQKTYLIVRYAPESLKKSDLRTTVVVPARNEMGNIAPLISRLPDLGPSCEVIFVEGHSTDATWDEINRQIAATPRKTEFTFKAFQQEGKGKADAVRLGFSKATGDLLMILDADLSVRPEDLAHFREGLLHHRAEFLNGSRLVYDMERAAMQLMNLFFNKLFGILISWLIGQPVKDTLCGTKVIYRKHYERIRKNFAALGEMDPFGDFELLFGASRLNLKIADVPVRYKERVYGSTNIKRWRHGWELLKMLLAGWKEMK